MRINSRRLVGYHSVISGSLSSLGKREDISKNLERESRNFVGFSRFLISGCTGGRTGGGFEFTLSGRISTSFLYQSTCAANSPCTLSAKDYKRATFGSIRDFGLLFATENFSKVSRICRSRKIFSNHKRVSTVFLADPGLSPLQNAGDILMMANKNQDGHKRGQLNTLQIPKIDVPKWREKHKNIYINRGENR